MRSLIGEFVFGIGIAILAGAFVLMWGKISLYSPDLFWTYVGILIIFGIILIIIGVKRIDTYDKMNKGMKGERK